MSIRLKVSLYNGLLLISLFIVVIFPGNINTQNCRSIERLPGKCVSLHYCPLFLNVLKNQPTPSQLRVLQKLTCGFEYDDPKVCCPIQIIEEPSEKPGSHNKAQNSTSSSSSPGALADRNKFPHKNFHLMPNLKECSNNINIERIIGGNNVSHGQLPWIARIGYKSKGSNKIEYYCGASVISKRYVLTANHCTENFSDGNVPVEIRVGESDASKEENCAGPELGHICSKAENYKIEKIIGHKDYSTSSKQNDISLIRVDRDILFNSYFIQPICLPLFKEYDLNIDLESESANSAYAAGFGRTKWERIEGSKVLLEVKLPIKTTKQCQQIYKKRVSITNKQLCAGGEAGRDSCAGDSGGPLMALHKIPKSRPKYFQIGITSFGPIQCGVGGLPGVYTSVSEYLDWILDNMEE